MPYLLWGLMRWSVDFKGVINVNEQQKDSEKPPIGIWTQWGSGKYKARTNPLSQFLWEGDKTIPSFIRQ